MESSVNWIWLTSGLTVLLSTVCVGLATRLSRRLNILASPGARTSHRSITPTGGGAGLVLAVVLVSVLPMVRPGLPEIWLSGLLPGFAMLSLVGWLDDRRTVSPLIRLLVQLAVSFWVLFSAMQMYGPPHEPAGIAPWIWFPFLGITWIWIMNAYNFMDGSHGMAGSEGLFAGLITGFLFLQSGAFGFAIVAFVLAAACLGFMPWNFPRPRVFMGDAGSVPLGFALGGLLLVGVMVGYLAWPEAILVLSVFLVDSTLTLLRRVLKGERWYTPHKQHVYQRLIGTGRSHSRVLLLYQVLNVFVVLPGIILCVRFPERAWLVTSLILLVFAFGWCAMSLKWGNVLERQANE